MKFKLNMSRVHDIAMVMTTGNGRFTKSTHAEWYVNNMQLGKGITKVTAGGVADEKFEMLIEGNVKFMDSEILELLIEVDEEKESRWVENNGVWLRKESHEVKDKGIWLSVDGIDGASIWIGTDGIKLRSPSIRVDGQNGDITMRLKREVE